MMNRDGHKAEWRDAEPADIYGSVSRLLGDAVFEFDPEGRSMRWSGDAAARLLGYDPGEMDLQRDDLFQLVADEDRSKLSQALETLLKGERVKVDVRLRRKDGEYVWVQLVGGALSVRGDDRLRIAGILRNTHDLHRALLSLHEARRVETVGNMASGIAHEFNNHLTPIRGYIELAQDMLGSDHPLAEGLAAALERVTYCADLVSQIQAYGRKSMLMPESVRVERLVPSSVRLALSSFPDVSDRIAVKQEWADELPSLWVDQGQFQQALLHLFRNAIEAMPNGGVLTIRAEPVSDMGGGGRASSTREREEEGFLCVSVADTGCGIHPEHRSRIFEPFFTTHNRAVARGMGLPMVQGMVAQHGGWMEMKTDVGQGTTVALFLPIQDPTADSGPVTDADGTIPVQHAAAPGRMLIADDEPFIRRLIKKVFQPEGWRIDEAGNNDEVLEMVGGDGNRYGLIVLDLTMPGASTEETIMHIRETDPAARILFISGYTRDERIERLLAMVKSDFISKPFSPKTLLTRVDELIR